MLKNMLILRDPLKKTGIDPGKTEKSGFAAILARAGVGKTALMVQIALNAMLKEKNVMHISKKDPVDKVAAWYEEVFLRLTQDTDPAQKTDLLWDELLHHRFIMTFETETFSIPKLQKRILELTGQNIFHPSMIMIDGFSFADTSNEEVEELHEFAQNQGLMVWFTARTHRDGPAGADGIPADLEPFTHLFENMILLAPEDDRIYLKPMSSHEKDENISGLYLDPSTMLIRGTTD
ncbi:MAG: cytoplasmic protein [Deltaproteobacteria bacterium]|nr:cytoplasmic protein [Deltaproteobacteria bacterium]